MEIKESHHHLQPLILPSTTTSSYCYEEDEEINFRDSRVWQRLILIFSIAVISIWANYQASQGFEINIINDFKDTPLGRKFNLFFVSNDKATQILLYTSNFVEQILYPDDRQPKKPIRRVTIRLTEETLTHQAGVKVEGGPVTQHEYVLHISSSLMEEVNVVKAMMLAVQSGITRVWLWNGVDSIPPENIVNGMVEYVNLVAGLVQLSDYRLRRVSDNLCWKDWDHLEVAQFLRYCETMKNGSIGRLNQAMMSDSWYDRLVDDALGVPAQQLCETYYTSTSGGLIPI